MQSNNENKIRFLGECVATSRAKMGLVLLYQKSLKKIMLKDNINAPIWVAILSDMEGHFY